VQHPSSITGDLSINSAPAKSDYFKRIDVLGKGVPIMTTGKPDAGSGPMQIRRPLSFLD
jgi:hypothetical protein